MVPLFCLQIPFELFWLEEIFQLESSVEDLQEDTAHCPGSNASSCTGSQALQEERKAEFAAGPCQGAPRAGHGSLALLHHLLWAQISCCCHQCEWQEMPLRTKCSVWSK